MIRPNTDRELRSKLARTRDADAAHLVQMTRIAARGGLSLDALRRMPEHQKEAFMAKHRDHDNGA